MKCVAFWMILVTVLGVKSSCTQTPTSDADAKTVLAPGCPPLTRGMVNQIRNGFEWILECEFNKVQHERVDRTIITDWKRNDRNAIENYLKVLALGEQLNGMSEAERGKLQGELQKEVIENLHRQPDDADARMLLEAYETAHRPHANDSVAPREAVGNGAAALAGLYVGYNSSFMPDPKGVVNHLVPKKEYFVLTSTGYLYRNIPDEGLESFDIVRAIRESPELGGTYVVSGKDIHLRWTDGSTASARIVVGGIRYDNDTYFLMPSCTGTRLRGVYYPQEQIDDPQDFLAFERDGTFLDNGVVNHVDRFIPGTYNFRNWQPGRGSYSITDNTLTLRYEDGRKRRLSFYTFPEEKKKELPDLVVLNSYALLLKQH
jgi:hypothetical protein